MNSQLKKGILELYILKCILRNIEYGYSILKEVYVNFPETEPSTVYGIIRRLISIELIEQLPCSMSSNGPDRKILKVTAKGEQYLNDSILDLKYLYDIITENDKTGDEPTYLYK